jgi:hypothetical protein
VFILEKDDYGIDNEIIAFNTRLDKPSALSQPGTSATSAGLQTV